MGLLNRKSPVQFTINMPEGWQVFSGIANIKDVENYLDNHPLLRPANGQGQSEIQWAVSQYVICELTSQAEIDISRVPWVAIKIHTTSDGNPSAALAGLSRLTTGYGDTQKQLKRISGKLAGQVQHNLEGDRLYWAWNLEKVNNKIGSIDFYLIDPNGEMIQGFFESVMFVGLATNNLDHRLEFKGLALDQMDQATYDQLYSALMSITLS